MKRVFQPLSGSGNDSIIVVAAAAAPSPSSARIGFDRRGPSNLMYSGLGPVGDIDAASDPFSGATRPGRSYWHAAANRSSAAAYEPFIIPTSTCAIGGAILRRQRRLGDSLRVGVAPLVMLGTRSRQEWQRCNTCIAPQQHLQPVRATQGPGYEAARLAEESWVCAASVPPERLPASAGE